MVLGLVTAGLPFGFERVAILMLYEDSTPPLGDTVAQGLTRSPELCIISTMPRHKVLKDSKIIHLMVPSTELREWKRTAERLHEGNLSRLVREAVREKLARLKGAA
jgi:hypothetical protein